MVRPQEEYGTRPMSPPPGLASENLPDFIERWGIDQESQQFLAGLPIDVQEEVIVGFDPPPGTRNVDAKLHAFARRVAVDMGHPELASRPGGGSGPQLPTLVPAGVAQKDSSRLSWSLSLPGKRLDSLSDFIARWGLDEHSEQMLRSQSRALIEEVVADFAPDSNTRNVNAKLYAFVKAKQAAVGTPRNALSGPPLIPDDTIRQFGETWTLDDTALHMLKQLAPEVCAGVLTDFNPPSDTQNVNAKLNAFVRGRLEKLGLPFLSSGGPAATVPVPVAPLHWGYAQVPVARHQAADPLKNFIDRWGCDSQNKSTLRQLQPEHQAMVIRDFDPPPGTYNVNGKLSSFIRSVVSRNCVAVSPLDATESFALQWRLDAEALQTLRNLPDELQSTVMAEFSPPAGTLNVSGKFSAFIRGKLATTGDGGVCRASTHARSSPDPERALQDFIARWRLDSEAAHLLRSLPQNVRVSVILDFQPKSDTWNPSGRLHAFVRARLKELGLEVTAAAGPVQRVSEPMVDDATESSVAYIAPDDDVAEFVEHWGLDRTSEELLRGLPEAEPWASDDPTAHTMGTAATCAL
mmetsp:Transcript_102904/g.286595  ORF Transcript_102904/g.286595 Transcript_102904/m.286595 type:complete len:577 (-) Transcript_102904:212-1942(-)